MKKALLIVGIICLAACVLSLLFALLNWIGYYNLMDGSADLYTRLHQRMIISFVASIILAATGIACMVLRFRK